MERTKLTRGLGILASAASLVWTAGCSLTQRSYAPCGNPLWSGQVETFISGREVYENGKEKEVIKVGDSDGVREFYALDSAGKRVPLRQIEIIDYGLGYSIDELRDGKYTAVLIDGKGNEYSTGFRLRTVIETSGDKKFTRRLSMDGLEEGTFKLNPHLSH